MEAEDSETKRLQTEKQGKSLLIQLTELICHTLDFFMYTHKIKIGEAQKNIQQEVTSCWIFFCASPIIIQLQRSSNKF